MSMVPASSEESLASGTTAEGGAERPSWCCAGGGSGRRAAARGGGGPPGADGWLQARPAPRCERVLVHVYDLGDSFLTRGLNSVAKSYGAFHTGVEVYGREWLFGVAVNEDDGTDPTGVSWHLPRENRDHSFRETLSMGFTSRSPEEVLQIVEEMKLQWRSSTYHVLTCNCHDFSNALCVRLGVAGLPSWVNSLAPAGADTYEYFENTDSGYDGGEALFEMWGSVQNSLYRGLGWDAKPAHRPQRGHAPLPGGRAR